MLGQRLLLPAIILIAAFDLYAGERVSEDNLSWLKQVQTPPTSLPDDAPTLTPLLIDEHQSRIESLDAWDSKRERLRKEWIEFLGLWDQPRPGNQVEIVSTEEFDGLLRQLIRYENEPGETVEAYLVRPADITKKLPGIVALHSTANQTIRQPAGIEGKPKEAWGPTLAKRGFVVLCPRCFLWGAEGPIDTKRSLEGLAKRHPMAKGMAKMYYDASRAVDVLAAMEFVDPQRLGSVGHSLGGKEVLYLAALDERIKVAVSSEGGIGTRFSNWHDPWYLTEAIQKPEFRHEHHELLALVAPRAFLLLGGDSADGARSWPFIEAVLPVYDLYGRPRRIGLLNHAQGHNIPPIAVERTIAWFEAYLGSDH